MLHSLKRVLVFGYERKIWGIILSQWRQTGIYEETKAKNISTAVK